MFRWWPFFLCDPVLHFGDNIRGRFNAISINISYKTYKSTKSPIVLQNHFAKMQKNQMPLSNDVMRLITGISKFSCLYSGKIICIRNDSVHKSFVFCKVLSLLSLQHVLNKRLLFEMCVVVAYFISFKPLRKSSCNLPW